MLSETRNQFCLTRAASSTSVAAKSKFLSVILLVLAALPTCPSTKATGAESATAKALYSPRSGPKIQINSISFDPNCSQPIKTARTGVPFIITVNLSNPGDFPAEGRCLLQLIRNGSVVASKTLFADTVPGNKGLNTTSISVIEFQFMLQQTGGYIARATWSGRKDYDEKLRATKEFSFKCEGADVSIINNPKPVTPVEELRAQQAQAEAKKRPAEGRQAELRSGLRNRSKRSQQVKRSFVNGSSRHSRNARSERFSA